MRKSVTEVLVRACYSGMSMIFSCIRAHIRHTAAVIPATPAPLHDPISSQSPKEARVSLINLQDRNLGLLASRCIPLVEE